MLNYHLSINSVVLSKGAGKGWSLQEMMVAGFSNTGESWTVRKPLNNLNCLGFGRNSLLCAMYQINLDVKADKWEMDCLQYWQRRRYTFLQIFVFYSLARWFGWKKYWRVVHFQTAWNCAWKLLQTFLDVKVLPDCPVALERRLVRVRIRKRNTRHLVPHVGRLKVFVTVCLGLRPSLWSFAPCPLSNSGQNRYL